MICFACQIIPITSSSGVEGVEDPDSRVQKKTWNVVYKKTKKNKTNLCKNVWYLILIGITAIAVNHSRLSPDLMSQQLMWIHSDLAKYFSVLKEYTSAQPDTLVSIPAWGM